MILERNADLILGTAILCEVLTSLSLSLWATFKQALILVKLRQSFIVTIHYRPHPKDDGR